MKTIYTATLAGIALVGASNAQTINNDYYTLNNNVISQFDTDGAFVQDIPLTSTAGNPITQSRTGLSYDGTFFYTMGPTGTVFQITSGGVQDGEFLAAGILGSRGDLPEDFAVTPTGFSALAPGSDLITSYDSAGNVTGTTTAVLPNGAAPNLDGLAFANIDGEYSGQRSNNDVRGFAFPSGAGAGPVDANIAVAQGFAVFQTEVPEPSSALLLGLGGLGLLARRKR